MTITAGIDLGSTYTKAVLFDEGDNVLAFRCEKLGANPRVYVELQQRFRQPK